MGQNFSWPEYAVHELEQRGAGRQRAGNFRDAVRRTIVENQCTCYCEPIKGQSKPQRSTSASSSTKTILIEERSWTDFELQDYLLTDYSVSKKLINLPRHAVDLAKKMERLNSGILKIIFGPILSNLNIGLMKSGRALWQEEEETIKFFSIVLILQEKFFISDLFKVIQDAILLILHSRTMS